ncbi:hexose transporter [Polyplosphaeria fusca]|uniref:Hexose transporter n=1 Tax=Polyplosphaeria fusca TaxID=682080 RepID=A0A9P4QLP3_9PLEO|nr:hexose transporter [Polyplosphaeria fusca]
MATSDQSYHFTRWTGLIISVCVADSVSFAYDNSLMGSLGVMPAYHKYFELTTALTSVNIAMALIGGIVIALVAGPIIDWKGRRLGILLACLTQILGAILQGCAQNLPTFIIGRFLIGGGTGLAQVACTSYVAETVPSKIRALALGLFLSCWAIGSLLAAGICYGTAAMVDSTWSWRIPSLLQAVPAIIVILNLLVIPESPRWLARHERLDEAVHIIAKVHGLDLNNSSVKDQQREILENIQYDKENRTYKAKGYLELFRTRGNLKRTLVLLSVAPCTMLSGSNIITFYFGTMFNKAGIHDSRTQLEIKSILSLWQLVVALAGSLSAERVGRRKLALASMSLAAIFLFLVGGLTSRYGEGTNKSGIYATIAGIFLFQGGYSLGMTPLGALYPAEIMSFSLRGYGVSLYAAFSRSCGILASFALPYGFDAIGWQMYIVNACFDVLLVIMIAVYWVETKGRTLEEIDFLFDSPRPLRIVDAESIQNKKVNAIVSGEVVLPMS